MSDVLDRDHEGELFRTRLVVDEGTARLTRRGSRPFVASRRGE
jgi:hypothetical protein